jgi:DNA-3-methyladenine glycosylase
LVVARELLGCILARREAGGAWTCGRIVETEAYIGEDDPACHAAAGLTPRTEVMYGEPGRAYVYFTYGMHHLLNVVTEPPGFPAAVLIRALHPLAGTDRMSRRRGGGTLRDLTSGPSRLCQALGIDLTFNRVPLRGPALTLRSDGSRPEQIMCGPRVGIRVGTDRPWRFWIDGDPCVSRTSSWSSGGRRRGGCLQSPS